MAYVEGDRCEVVSRRGKAFKSFAPLRRRWRRSTATLFSMAKSSASTPPASRSSTTGCGAEASRPLAFDVL
jgi:hypothetical protein